MLAESSLLLNSASWQDCLQFLVDSWEEFWQRDSIAFVSSCICSIRLPARIRAGPGYEHKPNLNSKSASVKHVPIMVGINDRTVRGRHKLTLRPANMVKLACGLWLRGPVTPANCESRLKETFQFQSRNGIWSHYISIRYILINPCKYTYISL